MIHKPHMRIFREVAEIYQALLRYVVQANLAIQQGCEYLLEPSRYTTQESLSGLVRDVFSNERKQFIWERL